MQDPQGKSRGRRCRYPPPDRTFTPSAMAGFFMRTQARYPRRTFNVLTKTPPQHSCLGSHLANFAGTGRQNFASTRNMHLLQRRLENLIVQRSTDKTNFLVFLGDPPPGCRLLPRLLLDVAGNRPHTRRDHRLHLRDDQITRLPVEIAHLLRW